MAVFAQKLSENGKYSICEAQRQRLMHTEWTLVCLSFRLSFQWCCFSRPLGLDDTANPLICDWYTHTHTHTRVCALTHISHSKASRAITDSASIIVPNTAFVRRDSLQFASRVLLAIGLTGCVGTHFVGMATLPSLAMAAGCTLRWSWNCHSLICEATSNCKDKARLHVRHVISGMSHAQCVGFGTEVSRTFFFFWWRMSQTFHRDICQTTFCEQWIVVHTEMFPRGVCSVKSNVAISFQCPEINHCRRKSA